MEEFFTSLSKRQTMLLLTSLSFNSSDAVAAYEHLSIDEEALLRHRALALLEVPREKRIPVLVGEIKRLVTQRRRQLGSSDPRRLAAVLKQERPAMVEVVLRALPVALADAVRVELGNPLGLPLLRELKPEVLSIIRWKLEEAMRQGAPQVGGFRFTDLVTLQQRELWAVADRMGARVLATAVAGLSEADRQALLATLPPDQRALATRAAEAGASRRLSERDAKLVLDMHGALENPSAGLRSAGAQRIARACLAQSPEFAQRMVERHQGELGRLLQRWVREERPKAVKGDGGRLDIVEQLERLAQKGIIDRPLRLPPPMSPPPSLVSPPKPRVPPAPVERRSSASRSPRPEEPPRPAERPPASAAPAPRPQEWPTDTGMPAAARSLAPRPLQPLPPRRHSGKVPVAGSPPPSEPPPPPPVARAPVAPLPVRRPSFPSYPGGPPRTADSGRGQRVLRDGKPLEWKRADPLDTLPPGSRVGPLEVPPRRRERPAAGRSPVVKGSGPKDGSR